MVRSFPKPEAATALLPVEPMVQRHTVQRHAVQRHVTCPLCHTTDSSLRTDALAAGGSWSCTRCGQRWNARRLATVAAYAAWALEHDQGIAAARRQPYPTTGVSRDKAAETIVGESTAVLPAERDGQDTRLSLPSSRGI
jgi:transcription elongation factor Elf1